jgi:hypothetical protein
MHPFAVHLVIVLGSSAPTLHDGSHRTPVVRIHQNVRKAGYVAYGTWWIALPCFAYVANVIQMSNSGTILRVDCVYMCNLVRTCS